MIDLVWRPCVDVNKQTSVSVMELSTFDDDQGTHIAVTKHKYNNKASCPDQKQPVFDNTLVNMPQ
jgi:hypothetical protein